MYGTLISDYLEVPIPSDYLFDVKMLILYTLVALYVSGVVSFTLPPEVHMNAPEMISFHGYPVETVTTTTKDGYLLELHHILCGRNEVVTEDRKQKPVVFLQHGLEDSSATWVANSPEHSAGFMFADAGFDVWLGNVRGNTYGKKHEYLAPSSHKFWDFSWDEMAEHDLPAMIDTVLERTGQKDLYYVGHSQGCLIMSAKLAEDPAFASKIKKFFAIAPISTVHHIKGLLEWAVRLLAFPGHLGVCAFEKVFGRGEFIAQKSLIRMAGKITCAGNPATELCSNVIFLITGPDSNQLDRSRIPVYLSHAPAGTSTRNLLHWVQMVRSGEMQKYDHNSPLDNVRKYGSLAPPSYDISGISVDTYLFWGDKDWLANEKDISSSFLKKLKPEVLKGNFKLKDFNHLDFVWGTRAAKEVYQPIIDIINSSQNAPDTEIEAT
uniref:Lipase n=1 Tax=Steinernema glaseri TaxID=37863 RepID=A0A1I7ZQM1_9BILA